MSDTTVTYSRTLFDYIEHQIVRYDRAEWPAYVEAYRTDRAEMYALAHTEALLVNEAVDGNLTGAVGASLLASVGLTVTPAPGPYDFLDDPAERAWLTNVDPQQVLDNAHRFYQFMQDEGMPADSFTRELAFTKASEALGVDYDVLYNAWLTDKPATATNKED